MLEASRVSWCQPAGALVSSVDAVIRPGEWISLMGPNGAGKSTFLQLISGVLGFSSRQFSGRILWEGADFTSLGARERAARVAYLGSDLDSSFPVTVREVLGSGVLASGDCNRIEQAMEFCELGSLMDRELNVLSGGERQRVLLARARVQGAKVLLLDETLSKMDPDYQIYFGGKLLELVNEGYSVVLVSHDLQLSVRNARRVWLMHEGKLVADGSPESVLTEANLSKLYPRASLAGLF